MDGQARIKIFGVGGGGCNAVNRMIEEGVKDVTFYAVNTDAQALSQAKTNNKIVLGVLGAGSKPEVGKASAEKHLDEIKAAVKDAEMVYITCGEGGGTGTGAAPIIAKEAKATGALTVAVVTKPFMFEGSKRNKQAEEGIKDLRKYVDSIIVVSNEKLLLTLGKLPMMEAFKESDHVLKKSIQAVTDLILRPALINLDFADIKRTMSESGNAVVGIGISKGSNCVVEATENALNSPLLETNLKTTKKAIVNITGNARLTLDDAYMAINKITELTNPDIDIIFGVSIEEQIKEGAAVTVILTGIEESVQSEVRPFKPEKEIHQKKTEIKEEPIFHKCDIDDNSEATKAQEHKDREPDFIFNRTLEQTISEPIVTNHDTTVLKPEKKENKRTKKWLSFFFENDDE